MKTLLTTLLLFATCAFSGDLQSRFQTATLDVQTDSSTNQAPKLPGLGTSEHIVSISITSTDYNASQFCVSALVALADGSTGGAHKCLDKDPMDGPVTFQFSTGTAKPVAWLRLLVTRMHAEPADQLVNNFRR